MTTTGSSDPNTNQVVAHVCGNGPGQAGLASCCTSRWSLLCVQAAAEHYLKTMKQGNLIDGDFCGRYAWTIGSVAGSKQQYPRDFSLFTLASDATNFTDVRGPVASAGKVTASSFALNAAKQEMNALVAKGDIDVMNGTIYGGIFYGGTYKNRGGVTILNPAGQFNPPAPLKDANAISFDQASARLTNMSTRIGAFDSIPREKPNSGTIKFVGRDEELNVFSLMAGDLTFVTSYIFDVPKGSHVIINVGGTGNAAFMNAGFSGPNGGGLASLPTSTNRILWNFPKIINLALQSVTFPGTILAPMAIANFRWGANLGTAVVGSASSSNELYMSRYEIPGRGGCLDIDSTWSCANDTTLDYATKSAAKLAPEAGFMFLEGGDYTINSTTRTSPNHRMWYSFQPSVNVPKERPLVVFFNGGPGTGTTTLLFSFNTSTWTLDPEVVGSNKISSNPSSWTKFANLLYIDAPGTGFSYPLPFGTGPQDVGMDIDRDAGFFLRFLMKFLARHPELQSNRVIIAGESYGGTRATLMLYYLYNYGLLSNGGLPYQDGQLQQELLRYFRAVFNKESVSTAEIASKFGHQILIQPGVVGQRQDDRRTFAVVGCNRTAKCDGSGCSPYCFKPSYNQSGQLIMPTCSELDCDQPNRDGKEYIYWKEDQATANLNTIPVLNQALGVDATTIKWMRKEYRVGAFGRKYGRFLSSVDMIKAFGNGNANDVLPDGDNYYVNSNDDVFEPYGGVARTWLSAGDSVGLDLLKNIQSGVSSFLTVVKFDVRIWSPSIPLALNSGSDPSSTPAGPFSGVVTKGGVVYDPRDSAYLSDRPGAMSINYLSGGIKKVAMPTAYESGHTVSLRKGSAAALLADVIHWYSHTPL